MTAWGIASARSHLVKARRRAAIATASYCLGSAVRRGTHSRRTRKAGLFDSSAPILAPGSLTVQPVSAHMGEAGNSVSPANRPATPDVD